MLSIRRLIVQSSAIGALALLAMLAGQVLHSEVVDRESAASHAANFSRRLPGSWRPFNSSSPWNTTIKAEAHIDPESAQIIALSSRLEPNLRFGNVYLPPLWVVDSERIPLLRVKSDYIYDLWDRTRRGWSDVGVPITKDMYAEPTKDGHIIIVDPVKSIAWEMSRFSFQGVVPTCSTFNVWDLNGSGVMESRGDRWWAIGGRGSGFPIIAGLLRPEEIQSGEVRHALVFTFPKNRRSPDGKRLFIPPAARSDGQEYGDAYPIEGMRFQLDPSLTDADFERWGLTKEAKIVARALQRYGMFDGDNGGAFAIQVQLLAPNQAENRRVWDELFPGLYRSIRKIPTSSFRVIYTGEPIAK